MDDIDPFEEIKILRKMMIEMNINLEKISKIKPQINLDSDKISEKIISNLPDFQDVIKKIDSIPTSIKTEIKWIKPVFGGWKLFVIWIMSFLATVAFSNYKLIWMHHEKALVILNYQNQVDELRKNKPKIANQYFGKKQNQEN